MRDARDDAIGCCWVVAGMSAAGNGSIGTLGASAILESPLISVTLTIAMILIIITIITRGIKGSSNNSSNNDRRVASLSTIQLSLRLGAAYGMPCGWGSGSGRLHGRTIGCVNAVPARAHSAFELEPSRAVQEARLCPINCCIVHLGERPRAIKNR